MSVSEFEITACGDDALRVLCGTGEIRHRLALHLIQQRTWEEVVVGKSDITVSFDPHAALMAEARRRLSSALEDAGGNASAPTQRHLLYAEFGGAAGPDLQTLAMQLGLGDDDLVNRIEQSDLRVDMLGFTPGFSYIAGLDASLTAERLANPRAKVPAGSIGLITGQIGLYALEGPGGWPIVGRATQPLFDRLLPDPFVLKPGDTVSLKRALPA